MPYTDLPNALYSSEQVRELDKAAMSEADIPGIVLMKRAGRAAFELLCKQWPQARHIVVICGGGNNGGDGYIVAALAAMQKRKVSLYSVVDPESLQGDARRARDFALQEGVKIKSTNELEFSGFGDSATGAPNPDNVVIVDAVLGLGFHSPLKSEIASVLDKMNASGFPILALDLPSGLNADTGYADHQAVIAAHTISFVGLKPGLFTGAGPEMCGELHFCDLAIPAEIRHNILPTAHRITRENALPKRKKSAHKNHFGHVLVVAGDRGMGGAGMLAAEAALRCGAGLVSLATRPEHLPAAQSRLPEVMTIGVNAGPELEAYVAKADVIVLGPGLGQSEWSQQLMYFSLAARKPTVIDADALNLLAKDGVDESFDSRRWILTPHPGEAARLLACSSHEIEQDRLAAVVNIARKYDCLALLKGAGSLIANDVEISLATVGNPGMAAPGMGDVLSGVIAALLGQKLAPRDALETAVCAHGYAGDRAAEAGECGLRASELMPYLREYLNWQKQGA